MLNGVKKGKGIVQFGRFHCRLCKCKTRNDIRVCTDCYNKCVDSKVLVNQLIKLLSGKRKAYKAYLPQT